MEESTPPDIESQDVESTQNDSPSPETEDQDTETLKDNSPPRWLTVLAVIVVIVAVILFIVIPPLSPLPTPTASPIPTATASSTASITPTATNSPTPTASPTPTQSPYQTILTMVQRYVVLETVRYHFEKVVPVEMLSDRLGMISGESLLYVAVGHVSAGVDLSKLSQGDITIEEDGHIIITLPPAYLTSCVIDVQKSYVYQQNQGALNWLYDVFYEEPNLLEEAEKQSVIAIRDSALENGILEEAQVDVQQQLLAILSVVGIEASFVTAEDMPPQHDESCVTDAP